MANIPIEVMEAIAQGKRILFAGTKPSNIPTAFRDHPRVVYWHNNNGAGNRYIAAVVPLDVGAILCTRFVSHTAQGNIAKQAKRLGAYLYPGVTGTNEIRRILRRIPTPMQATHQAQATHQTQSVVITKETMRDFLRRCGDRSVRPMSTEAKRLFVLAKAAGLTKSPLSVSVEWSRIVKHEGPATAALLVAHPLQVPQPLPVAPARVEHDNEVEAILRMLDDGLASLTLAKETIMRLSTESTVFQRIKQMIASS